MTPRLDSDDRPWWEALLLTALPVAFAVFLVWMFPSGQEMRRDALAQRAAEQPNEVAASPPRE